MSQFTKRPPVRREQPVIQTTTQAVNHQGGPGYRRDAKSELFMLGVTTMWGKDTFYEPSDERQQRFVGLVQAVCASDPMWLAKFIPWLRDEAGIRTAAIVAAVEYAYTVRTSCPDAPWADARQVVASTPQRADEPAEMLAYAMATRGRRIPKPLKKGLADACTRMYDGMTLLKYDSKRATTRPGDVIALTHPKPLTVAQEAIFTALLDARHGRAPKPETMEGLPGFVYRDLTGEKAATWERSSSDGKANWDEQIPTMGVMALLRNLRNFDRDGISEQSVKHVKERLDNAEAVRKARVFPLRFLAAWDALESVRWGESLEAGLGHSLANVPVLDGETLILWDCSGSMVMGHQNDSWKRAGVFAVSLARRAEDAHVVVYSNAGFDFPVSKGGSILRDVEKVRSGAGLWGGTNTWGVVAQSIEKWPTVKRVVIVTDEQTSRGMTSDHFDVLLGQRPCYILNIAGYEFASAPSDRVVAFAGLNDRCFTAITQAEAALTGTWPWE